MSVASAAPRNARLVYLSLIILGVAAAIVASTVIGVISYNYVTRDELRNPVPQEKDYGGGHASLPAGFTYL